MNCLAIPIKDEAYWLEWQLQNWSRWMRSDERPEGLPDKACGGIAGYVSGGYDHGESYETMDCLLAESCNAAIEGLCSLEQSAIYSAYGVIDVMHWKRANEVLERAKANVMESLKRRGIWLGQ